MTDYLSQLADSGRERGLEGRVAHAEAHRDRVVVVVSASPGVGIPNLPRGRVPAPPVLPRGDVVEDVATLVPRCVPRLCLDGERECPVPRRYRGSSRIEGYWNVLFCEACRAPPRPRDPRIPFSVDGVGDKLDAQNNAREELAMLQREAQPKQKPVKTL